MQSCICITASEKNKRQVLPITSSSCCRPFSFLLVLTRELFKRAHHFPSCLSKLILRVSSCIHKVVLENHLRKKKSSNFDDCCRSKNLDILFKRDYYEQRLAIQRLASEQADKEAQGQTQGEEVVEAEEVGKKMFSVVIILFLSWHCSLFEERSLKSAAAGGRAWQQRGRRGRKRDGRHCSSSWSDTQAGQVL